MKDIPMFATELGIASLVLKDVPARQTAYVRIGDAKPENLTAFLAECVSFCRMCGAEYVLATGHDGLKAYPVHAVVLEMRGQRNVSGNAACLFPVTEKTAGKWREIYNRRMSGVDNAAALSFHEEKRLAGAAGTYFVHDGDALLGIGWIEGDTLLAVASVKPGAGAVVLRTLMGAMEEENIRLEVASTNERAIALYESFGFVKTREIQKWYRIG